VKPNPHAHLYNHRWSKARLLFLQANPLCVMCQHDGYITAATVVDHITPHKGDLDLFWNDNNWQALCKTHHDSVKQAQEKSGVVRGHYLNGEPIDPSHHWNNV
jgi:5-methylcytosine-specific restriction endonuclease McrA